jgi:hypothetical protein
MPTYLFFDCHLTPALSCKEREFLGIKNKSIVLLF